VAGENLALARKYFRLFEPALKDGERLLTASAAIWVAVSEAFGRGAGDGTLGVTDQRVLHVGSKARILEVSRTDIVDVTRKWIVLPGSSQLDLRIRRRGSEGSVTQSFYCGTGFSKDLLRLLG
jgi:hypothetical protein